MNSKKEGSIERDKVKHLKHLKGSTSKRISVYEFYVLIPY